MELSEKYIIIEKKIKYVSSQFTMIFFYRQYDEKKKILL